MTSTTAPDPGTRAPSDVALPGDVAGYVAGSVAISRKTPDGVAGRGGATSETHTPAAGPEVPVGTPGTSPAVTATVSPVMHTALAGSPDATTESPVSPGVTGLLGRVSDLIARLHAGLDGLVEVADGWELLALTPSEVLGVAREFEALRNRLAVFDHAIVQALEASRAWEPELAGSTAGLLAAATRISHGRACARVKAASLLRPQDGCSAGPLPPALPEVAQAQRRGEVSEEHVGIITKCVADLRAAPVDPSTVTEAETTLVEFAAVFGPKDLARTAQHLLDVQCPDGQLDRDRIAQARREITVGPAGVDGTHRIQGRLTALAAAKLNTVFDALAAPQPADASGPDTRSAGQRRHDAFEGLTDIALRSNELPDTGGTPTTLIVTIDLDALQARYEEKTGRFLGPGDRPIAATGCTQHGTWLPLKTIIDLATQAQLIPVFLSRTDGICAYGTATRLATPGQTRALIARDRGCSFPGCDRPASWCERHHIRAWQHGGQTDLDNLTLLCAYHHREHHIRGWHCRMINGYPHWIPPTWIDPTQKPQLHARIATHHNAPPP